MNFSGIEGIHFQPWIGKEYYVGRKLLLLGESHYLDEEPDEDDDFSKGYDDLTIKVVRDKFLSGKINMPFFKNIGLLFYPDDCFKIWDEIAFANAIQIALPHAKSQPEDREIRTIVPAFKLLLDNLKPEKVIVFSKRMWNRWIPEDNANFISHIKENGKKSTVWKYNYSGGKCLATGVCHPSRMFGNSHSLWKPIIDKFISM